MYALEQVFPTDSMQDRTSHVIPEEAIRERAYEIYERRGREDGRAEEDWFEAETELRNRVQLQENSWT
jgi:hypothetical protein